jgi:twitching motility protein PilU
MEGKIDRKEGLAYADSPTNLMWRLQNDFALAANAAKAKKSRERGVLHRDHADDHQPSFTEITPDVKPALTR